MRRVHHLDAEGREAVLQRLTEAVAERADIAFAYAHGSFLRQDGFHDIDVAVWTTENATRRTDLELASDLSRAAGCPVDVRAVNHAPVTFLFHVFRGRPLAVHDEGLLADLLERTARTYHDYAPLFRQATREAFGA